MSTISEKTLGKGTHYITSKYGWRTLSGKANFHGGTDYGTHQKNLPIYALEDGEVYSKGYERGGAGYYIWVKYPRLNKRFLYCHMKAATTLTKGQKVFKNTLLGYVGTTGNSTGIHLHLGVRDLTTGNTEDPEVFSKTYDESFSNTSTSTTTNEDVYTTGRYKVNTSALRVRTGPGTGYRQKLYKELSANARSQILKLNNGKTSNCFVRGMILDVSSVSGEWGKTYSGWVCLKYCVKE